LEFIQKKTKTKTKQNKKQNKTNITNEKSYGYLWHSCSRFLPLLDRTGADLNYNTRVIVFIVKYTKITLYYTTCLILYGHIHFI